MKSGSTVYVVGSGPAGIACAEGLVRRGLSVVLLDAGTTLEPERQASLETLRARRPRDWDPAVIASWKDRVVADSAGVQIKYVYGSDYPYRDVNRIIPRQSRNIGHLTPSLAQAGFSNIWGAALLPYTTKDMESWPIQPSDLEPHYRSILSCMRLSAKKDDLADIYPLHTDEYDNLAASRQAVDMLNAMGCHRDALKAQGLIFGSSRLALRAGCVYCGLCMHGCPYGLIYSTNQTLLRLTALPNFRLQTGVIVRKIKELPDGVSIHAQALSSSEPLRFEGAAVFLAAGALSTTRILLESLEAYDRAVGMKVSEYFLLPLMRYRKIPNVQEENLHTLAQIFIECFDRGVSEHSVHMQIYTYSDLYEKALRGMFRFAGPFLRMIQSEILGRMLVIQGYLHSDLSSSIAVRLDRDEHRTLRLEGISAPAASSVISKVVGKLMIMRRQTGCVPIRPLLKIGRPGEGRHVGGTFPMRSKPAAFESDCLGRPHGFKRVHAVDATILPTIPAPPITFNVMANAHRIAEGYAR